MSETWCMWVCVSAICMTALYTIINEDEEGECLLAWTEWDKDGLNSSPKTRSRHLSLFGFVSLFSIIHHCLPSAEIQQNTELLSCNLWSLTHIPVNQKRVTAAINSNNYVYLDQLTLQYHIKTNEWQHFTALQLMMMMRGSMQKRENVFSRYSESYL